MNRLEQLLNKNKSIFVYAIFGVFTTAVNIGTYNICYYAFELSNTLSNVIAWIMAVTFAYLTNKVWVFESKIWKWEVLKREISAFVSCRVATGVLDLGIMYICVDVLCLNAMLMKMISNLLVIILNYIFSKVVIFKKE